MLMKQSYSKTLLIISSFILLACYQHAVEQSEVVSEPVVTLDNETLNLNTENVRRIINNKRFSGLIHVIDDDRQL